MIFNKYLAVAVAVVLIFASLIKFNAMTTTPGVSPNTEGDWNYRALQRVDGSQNSFSFAFFGDNKNAGVTFDNLIKSLNKEKGLSFAIDAGDLVFEGELEKYHFFLNQARQIKLPLLTAIGNHETYSNGRGRYYNIFGPFYYSFTIGQSYFIVLDDANQRRLDAWQTEWLVNQLDVSQNYKYRFVVMHTPVYDPQVHKQPGEYNGLRDREFADWLSNVFQQYQVTMILESHVHGFFEGQHANIPFVLSGAAGAGLGGDEPANFFDNYVVVNVSDAGVDYRVVHFPNPGNSFINQAANDIWIYGYAYISLHYTYLIIFVALLYICLFLLYLMGRRHDRKIAEAMARSQPPKGDDPIEPIDHGSTRRRFKLKRKRGSPPRDAPPADDESPEG